MKLTAKTPTPVLKTTDLSGHPFDLSSFKGQKVLLSFMRFAGCPVCNFRVHELLKNKEAFEQRHIKVVLVYESSVEKMKEYVAQEEYPFTFIADPEGKWYRAFSVENSFAKFLRSFVNGALSKAFQGMKLFKRKPANDGSVTRIGADFLIDEKGMIQIAHYGAYMGDDLPLSRILAE